ncbi:MAG: RyR domain-containing protein [Terracidiphilus sp.]|jgi:hypothetical protein
MAAKTVVVTGDFTLDWNLARGFGPEALNRIWEAAVCSRLQWQRGGTGLLADLICEVNEQVKGETAYKVRQAKTPKRTGGPEDAKIGPEDKRFHHSYAAWQRFDFAEKGSKAAEGRETEKAWRVAEFEGVNRCGAQEAGGDWAKVVNDECNAALVVLDDADLGFRKNRDLWPASLNGNGNPWVLVKMSRPVADADNGLWKLLCERHAGRLIVVMTANDLRRTTAQITHGLSWERTAQDLVWELTYNQALSSLLQCAHVIVSFDAAGAFVYSRDAKDDERFCAIFDPDVVEGMWEKTYPGRMVGYSSCLTAGIARELMVAPEQPNIQLGVCSGLWALRSLHQEGYGEREGSAVDITIKFPIKTVVNALETFVAPDFKHNPYRNAFAPMRSGGKYWTILETQCENNLESRATEVVRYGPKTKLRDVPLGRFGKLLTVDRQEIESLRSIGSLMTEYLAQKHPERPLSIAVFGPPGSGKSFGIKQLAQSIQPGEIEVREFNLSQFRSFDGLMSAFHQVRDIALSGKVPLIFWDEFDSEFDGVYGWLRYFLSPMQDGVFLQGDLPHPIGKAIFVFAGGTSPTLAGFGRNGDEGQLRTAKVPDFLSRLKGYLNVLGPNPQTDTDMDDPFYVLRRAILLRSMVERNAAHLVQEGEVKIDDGVLRALLLVKSYHHGARSMESILTMSQLDGKVRFERSSLPTKAQLDLHVDGQNFLALVHQLNIDSLSVEKLELMAREAHKVYCEQQEAEGWKLGPLVNEGTNQPPSQEIRDRMAKIARKVALGEVECEGWKLGTEKNKATMENPVLVDYDQLSEKLKDQNRSQVRDIPAKLSYVGLTIIRTQEGEAPFVFPNHLLELLADREHTRWTRQKAKEGWRYGDPSSEATKEHSSMLPWTKGKLDDYRGFAEVLGEQELSNEEKDKDRSAVRGMARILNIAGYTITGAHSKTKHPDKRERTQEGTYKITWEAE